MRARKRRRGSRLPVMCRLDGYIFAPGSPRQLASVRIGLCSVLALRLALGPFSQYARAPDALFRPLSFMRVLSGMPPVALVVVLQILGALAAILAAAGVRTRVSLPIAWSCGLLLCGVATSLGQVMHNDVLLLLCVAALLPAPTGDAWGWDARHRPPAPESGGAYGWPVRLASIIVAGSYLGAGLEKLIHSGPAWAFSENMRWILYASSDAQRTPNAVALFIADHLLLAVLASTAILALELSFWLVLVVPRSRWILVPAAVLVHVGTALTLHLDYSRHAATVVIVLVFWPTALSSLRSVLGGLPHVAGNRVMSVASREDRQSVPW